MLAAFEMREWRGLVTAAVGVCSHSANQAKRSNIDWHEEEGPGVLLLAGQTLEA